jgi:hypothetical protein
MLARNCGEPPSEIGFIIKDSSAEYPGIPREVRPAAAV